MTLADKKAEVMHQARLAGLTGGTKRTDAALECTEMTLAYEIKNVKPAILIDNTVLIKYGEFVVPIGSPGVGKTTLDECFIAAFLSSKYHIDNVDTFKIQVNASDGKCLLADSERTPDDCSKTYKNIFKRTNYDAKVLSDDGTRIKDLTHLVMSEIESAAKMRDTLESYLKKDKYELVILDGGLDFCEGMNDEERAIYAVRWIRSQAVKYNCAFVVTVHPNKGTTTPAGHFGAFLIKWARAVFLLRTTADKSIKEITIDFDYFKLSHADPAGFSPVYFSWDNASGMMRTCDEPKAPTYKIEFLKRAIMELRLQGHNAIPSGTLKEHYGKLVGLSEDRAKKHISLAVEDGLLILSGKGKAITYTPAPDWSF